LTITHIFLSCDDRNGWNMHHQAIELVKEIGKRTTNIAGNERETSYLFEQMSIALQRGNAVSFQSTFTTS